MGELCGKITASNLNNCLVPLQGGMEDEMIVVNYSDIAVKTINVADGLTVENVTLDSGAQGFVIDGLKNSIDPDCQPVEVGVFDRYTHSVAAHGFDISNTARAAADGMTGGRVVAFVRNKYKGVAGNAEFLVYGLDSGLSVKIAQKQNDDTQGAFQFTFATVSGSEEPHLPRALYDTDAATTLAVWESLKLVAI